MGEYTSKIKNIKDIENLPTKRLLTYYKARRKDRINVVRANTCECCGEPFWDMYPNDEMYKEYKKEYDILESHLIDVKELLAKRENLKK